MNLTKHRLNNFVTVGKVLNAYGLQGQVKVDVYFKNLKLLQAVNDFVVGNSLLKTKIKFLRSARRSTWIASIAETKEKAEEFKGQLIFLKKKFLPKLMADEFYYEDLKGLQIMIDESIQKGFVKDIFNFGSGDVLEVSLDDREATIYIPFDRDNVSKVDLADRKIILTPIKGIIT